MEGAALSGEEEGAPPFFAVHTFLPPSMML